MSEQPLSEGFLPSLPGSPPGVPSRSDAKPGRLFSQPVGPHVGPLGFEPPGGAGGAPSDPGSRAARADGESGTLAGAGTQEAAGEGSGRKRRRRGSRGGRRRSKRARSEETAAAEAPEPAEPSAPKAAAESGETPAPGRRKRARRSRKKPAKPREEEAAPAETGAESKDSGGEERRSRKRGQRGGRRRRKKKTGSSSEPGGSTAVGIEYIPGEEDELPRLSELPDDTVLVENRERGRSREGRGRRRGGGRDRSERSSRSAGGRRETAKPPSAKKRIILVNAGDPEEQRVAVVEDGRIVDLQMTVKKHSSFVSDIYRGRVVNIESAIGAAFVDFGEGRNGFLHASDVLPSYGEPDWRLDKLLSTPVPTEWESDDKGGEESKGEGGTGEDKDEEKQDGKDESQGRSRRGRDGGRTRSRRVRLPIDRLLKKGQMVVVQITKDAIGDKGPTLTTYVSIPGRYLVLMPSLERTGVSRKIDDEKERRRLKRILSSLEIPEGMGVIVRTAGIGKTKTEISRDLEYLLLAWDDFAKRLKMGHSPAPLYQESDVAIRTMRDLFTSETEQVVVDDEEVHGRMIKFTEKLMPEHLDRIRQHTGPRPLFQAFGVEQDFERIFARRVELPSGGSIVLDQTEALVAIDVNSGRTREEGAEFEDIALKTNLEAVPEIARQIRLRDLGGIIVLDYIDMMRASGRRAVEAATREAFKWDRARSKIGRISQFGLLELTRQRLGPGLTKLVYDTCPRCRGSGRRRNASSRAQAILRRLGSSLALKGFTSVEVRAHPEVIEYLEKELPAELEALETASGRKLVLMSVPDQVEDSVLHYLRADGREVRPGGRRKR